MDYPVIFLLLAVMLITGCGKAVPLALGTLERDRIVHNATAAEVITALPIAEGSPVAQGDLLVQLDDRRQRASVALAQAQLRKASARWDELRSGARIEDIEAARAKLAGAQASLSSAEKTFRRARTLRNDKLNSQADYDQALSNRDNALAQVRASEEQLLVLTNGVREEVLRQGEADVQAAQAQLELAQLALQEMSVTSTRDGYLDSLPWHRGERVNIGTPVAVVLANTAPYGRVYIPETQRAAVKIGDAFTVHLDGTKKTYQARLRWVANEPAFSPYYALNEAERARLVFLAELDLENGSDLPSGMPIQVYFKAP